MHEIGLLSNTKPCPCMYLCCMLALRIDISTFFERSLQFLEDFVFFSAAIAATLAVLLQRDSLRNPASQSMEIDILMS